MAKGQSGLEHGPWTGVRTANDAGEEGPSLLYDATNCYIPDPVRGSGIAYRPPVTVQQNPLTGRVGQCIHDHYDTLGRSYRLVVRGGRLESRDGTLATPSFTDITPSNVQIDPTARVSLTSFADKVIVNDGVNVPWVFDPGSNTGTRIAYTTPAVTLSRGVPDKTVAVAATVVTLSSATATRSSAGLPITGTVIAATWGAFRVSVSSTGVFTVTPQSASQNWAVEATAITNLPAVPAGQWDCGYFTVKAAGVNWVGGTDALQGGASGTPANTTNYYASAYTSWTARGKPVVYSGQAMFIVDTVAGVSASSTLAWSEILAPFTGYAQANYDNQWTLSQTSAEPLWALAPTNGALYYFRRTSIGEITGAISRTWRTEATLDSVSTTIGSTAWASVLVAHDAVWFVSDGGLPHRFAIGSKRLDPIWRNLRDRTDGALLDGLSATLSNTPYAMSAYQPELELVVMAIRSNFAGTVTTLSVFHAESGTYHGQWVLGTFPYGLDAMGVTHEYTGQPYLAFLGASDASTPGRTVTTRGAFLVQWRLADIGPSRPLSDDGVGALPAGVTLSYMLGDGGSTYRFDRLRARVRCAQGALAGQPRRFQVTLETPWATSPVVLTPLLSDGVADDRVLVCGLGAAARWIRPTFSGPVLTGFLLAESGATLTTESASRLALSGADTPLLGQAVIESVEATAHRLGRDPVPR